jgi:Transglycosylase SLT domain
MKAICSIIAGWMLAVAITTPLAAQNSRITVVVHPDLKTGRLIRSVEVLPRDVAARVHAPLAAPARNGVAASSNMMDMVDRLAAAYGVEAPLVHSVIRAESNYNPSAVSDKGAMGMMQLIPSTARRFGVQNPFDARQNVEGGVRYLRFLLDYYNNDYPKAIAAYNAGEGAVDRYRGIPPYVETRNYVYQVARNLRVARQAQSGQARAEPVKAGGSGATASLDPEKNGTTSPEEAYNRIRASLAGDGRVYYRTE